MLHSRTTDSPSLLHVFFFFFKLSGVSGRKLFRASSNKNPQHHINPKRTSIPKTHQHPQSWFWSELVDGLRHHRMAQTSSVRDEDRLELRGTHHRLVRRPGGTTAEQRLPTRSERTSGRNRPGRNWRPGRLRYQRDDMSLFRGRHDYSRCPFHQEVNRRWSV